MNREIRALIRQMSIANPLWGAPRIHGEMLKLGLEVSQATAGRHMVRRHGPPSPTWRTFLRNQVDGIAIDMFVVVTAAFRLLYVSVILSHARRKILHLNVTQHPTAGWLPPDHRGISVGHRATLPAARRRHVLRGMLSGTGSGYGDRGGRYGATIALAESVRRASHLLDSPRFPRPRHCDQREPSAPRSFLVYRLLPTHTARIRRPTKTARMLDPFNSRTAAR